MARIRSIKPDFFTDADLGELSPLHRLLFAGLWCLQDRNGVCEDKPREIKVKALPYDACDVDAMLWDLAEGGFIVRYEASGEALIFTPGFSDHQHPHKTEKGTGRPEPHENGYVTVIKRRDGKCHIPDLRQSSVSSLLSSVSSLLSLGEGSAAAPPPPVSDPVSAAGGLKAPAAILAGAVPDRRAPTPAAPGEGVGELADNMGAAWLDRRGVAFAWGLEEERAVAAALGKPKSGPEEVLRRWRNALEYEAFPVCHGVKDLVRHWNAYATGPPRAKGRASERDKDWSRVGEQEPF